LNPMFTNISLNCLSSGMDYFVLIYRDEILTLKINKI
jgi:hypothetical protein